MAPSRGDRPCSTHPIAPDARILPALGPLLCYNSHLRGGEGRGTALSDPQVVTFRVPQRSRQEFEKELTRPSVLKWEFELKDDSLEYRVWPRSRPELYDVKGITSRLDERGVIVGIPRVMDEGP
jgi:hypothetical protein